MIVIEIFNSFTDISFLKDFTNIYFFISYCVQEKFLGCLKVQLSVAVSIFYQIKELISCTNMIGLALFASEPVVNLFYLHVVIFEISK